MPISILEKTYNFKGQLIKRQSTRQIILHHEAGYGGGDSIHKSHQANGWIGIGYHFVVRNDGTIERGRPESTVGAHCYQFNSDSIGICFEGNFERDIMTKEQIESGQRLLSYLYEKYGLNKSNVFKHKDKMATACPGRNFPFDEIVKGYDKSNATITNNCKLYKEKNDWCGYYKSLKPAKRVEIMTESGDGWSRVLVDDTEGFIKNSCLHSDSREKLSSYPMCKITETVWLRSSRSVAKSNKLLKIEKGDKFKLLGRGKKWLYVKTNGECGYIVKKKTTVK